MFCVIENVMLPILVFFFFFFFFFFFWDFSLLLR